MLSTDEEDELRGEKRGSASGRERAVGYRATPRSEPVLRLTTRRLRQKLEGCDGTWTLSCFEVAELREVSPLRVIHEACE